MLLEETQHDCSSFVTLTYNKNHVPVALCDGSPELVLYPRHLTLWIKRLRKAAHLPLRFFGVGEYGEKLGRPHYHAVMYGLHPTPENEALVRETWGKGNITLAPLEKERIFYCAYYTTKKWTRMGQTKLRGRPPEFSRQSRRPGIGVPAISGLAAPYLRNMDTVLALSGDVQTQVRIDGKLWPLDAHMLKKLRQATKVPVLARDRWPKPAVIKDYAQAAKREKLLRIAATRPHGTL